jgi:hypothetical protein
MGHTACVTGEKLIKVKSTCPCVPHKGVWWSGDITPLLYLGTTWRYTGQRHAPAHLSPGKEQPVSSGDETV